MRNTVKTDDDHEVAVLETVRTADNTRRNDVPGRTERGGGFRRYEWTVGLTPIDLFGHQ